LRQASYLLPVSPLVRMQIKTTKEHENKSNHTKGNRTLDIGLITR